MGGSGVKRRKPLKRLAGVKKKWANTLYRNECYVEAFDRTGFNGDGGGEFYKAGLDDFDEIAGGCELQLCGPAGGIGLEFDVFDGNGDGCGFYILAGCGIGDMETDAGYSCSAHEEELMFEDELFGYDFVIGVGEDYLCIGIDGGDDLFVDVIIGVYFFTGLDFGGAFAGEEFGVFLFEAIEEGLEGWFKCEGHVEAGVEEEGFVGSYVEECAVEHLLAGIEVGVGSGGVFGATGCVNVCLLQLGGNDLDDVALECVEHEQGFLHHLQELCMCGYVDGVAGFFIGEVFGCIYLQQAVGDPDGCVFAFECCEAVENSYLGQKVED